MIQLILCAVVALAPFAASGAAPTGEPRGDWSFKEASMIPVQSGGRVKPLDTLARESVLFITGSHRFAGWGSTDLMFSWLTAPQAWESRPFIRIGNQDVRRQLRLDENRKLFSPAELFQQSDLIQYASTMDKNRNTGQPATVTATSKPSPRDQELRRVIERVSLYRTIVTGEAWPVIPGATSQMAWDVLAGKNAEGESVRNGFARMAMAYRDGDQPAFISGAQSSRAAIEAKIEGWGPGYARLIGAEYVYNVARPFHWSWIFYLSASILLTLSIFANPGWAGRLQKLGFLISAVGFISHICGMSFRSYVAGRPPVTNMYESIVWVSFGVMVFAYIIYSRQRQAVILATACAWAAFTLLSADASPSIMDPGIHPLVPVLRSNFWLMIHVMTITLSYAAFMLSLGLANLTLFHYIQGDPTGQSARVLNLNQLAYRAMQFGVVLLAGGTILGGVWADYSWGRFWGWDPKEVWALCALLTYLSILHARFTGWIGQFGFAAATVLAFLSVVMAWYGVNFVLGVGLHSYGFSNGGQGVVGLFCLAQIAYVAVAAIRKRTTPKSPTPTPKSATI